MVKIIGLPTIVALTSLGTYSRIWGSTLNPKP